MYLCIYIFKCGSAYISLGCALLSVVGIKLSRSSWVAQILRPWAIHPKTFLGSGEGILGLMVQCLVLSWICLNLVPKQRAFGLLISIQTKYYYVLYNDLFQSPCRFKDDFVWKLSKTALITLNLLSGPQLIFVITLPSWSWLHRKIKWLTCNSPWWILSLVETNSYLFHLLATFRCFRVRCVNPGQFLPTL